MSIFLVFIAVVLVFVGAYQWHDTAYIKATIDFLLAFLCIYMAFRR